MPFRHQIIQSETLWKCWRVGLIRVFPPEYNVHNTADFFFTFLVLETFVEPVKNGLRDRWRPSADQARQKECWLSLTFSLRSSPGIVFIGLWWSWVWGREERIFSKNDSYSGAVEEAWAHTLRDFGPQPLRLQPKEESEVKRSDRWFRDKIMTTGVGLFQICGLETSPDSLQASPISYATNYHLYILKAEWAYSYKSLRLVDVPVASVPALIFGSLTCVFPDLWGSQIVCSCRIFSFFLMGHFWKTPGPSASRFQNYSILSRLRYWAWNLRVDRWLFSINVHQAFLYNSP